MAFPTSSLTNNQVHKEGNRAFVYDSALGVWDQVRETDRTENKILQGEIGDVVTYPAGHVLEVKWLESTSSSGNQSVSKTVFYGFGSVVSLEVPTGQTVIMQIGGGLSEHDAGTSHGICVNWIVTFASPAFPLSTTGTFGGNTGTNSTSKQMIGPVMAKYSNTSGSTTKLNMRAGMSGWETSTRTAAWYADGSMNHTRWLMATRIVT